MALDPVPWFVGGGAEHSPDVARMIAYAATGGKAGVLGPNDFKVTSLPVPGTSVRIAAGAAVVLNGYLAGPDYGKQSYIPRAADITDESVTATGSAGGRTDLVVVRMDDPQFGGQTPADPVVGPYNRFEIIENVAPGTASADELDLGYPAYALARLDIPASTGTIQQNMITDLRHLAMPKRERRTYYAGSSGTPAVGAVDPLNSASYVTWPDAATWNVPVPIWATHAIIRSDVQSYVVKAGDTAARLRVKLGTVTGLNVGSVDENINSGTYRNAVGVIDTLAIPDTMRGTVQNMTLQAQRTSGTGYCDADTYTSSMVDVEFIEQVL